MCNCQSYNMGGGEVPEVVLYPKSKDIAGGRESVCVDACIAGAISHLWECGLQTLNSCCGHGKESPSVVVPESGDPHEYLSALAAFDGRHWVVLRWELVAHTSMEN